jgi:hypothetical protein
VGVSFQQRMSSSCEQMIGVFLIVTAMGVWKRESIS